MGIAISVLTFLGQFLATVDFGEWSVVVMGVAPPLLTAAIRFLRNNNAE